MLALSLGFATLHAAPAQLIDVTAISTTKMADCKVQTCTCEKNKPACDMNMECSVGCVGLKLPHVFSLSEHSILVSEMSFEYFTEALVSVESAPLRRPPRA